MLFNRGYKYRLNRISKEQKQLLFSHIFNANQTWNILLNQKMKEYQDNLLIEDKSLRKYINLKEQDDLVKNILRNRLLSINTKVLQQTRIIFNKDFQKTIKKFIKGQRTLDGMLKFKSSKNFNGQSFQTTKEQYKIIDIPSQNKYKILRLFNQNFYIRYSRKFPKNSDIKTITITYKNNQFYISFNVIFEEENKLDTNLKNITSTTKLKSMGMDINLDTIDLGNLKIGHKQFDIKNIKNNNLKKIYKTKLKKLERKQARRVINAKKSKIKLGKNFKKTQDKINKFHEKNTNIKIFKLHGLVNEIICYLKKNKINHIVIEDLNIKNMTKKSKGKIKDKITKKIGKSKVKEMKKNILQISLGLFVEVF